jgi:CHAT domain-containing protein
MTTCQLGGEEREPTGLATAYRIPEFGLEMANQRATGEAWTLDRSSNYSSSEEEKRRVEIQRVYRLALQQRSTSQSMVPLDLDLDGRADWWAFYAAGVPIFLETDRFDTGCHDLRVDLREKEWSAEEYHGWSKEPPVPLTFDSGPQISFRDLYDWAGRSELAGVRGWPLTQHNLRVFPGLAQEIAKLAANSGAELGKQLDVLAQTGESLLPTYIQVHQKEAFRDSLSKPNVTELRQTPYDLDRKPGNELVVTYAPWGVYSIRFFQKDWMEDAAPLAEVFFEGLNANQIQLGNSQIFRVSGHWLRIAPDARKKIARECLERGYLDFREQHFYAAIHSWERGLSLAGLLGDLHSSPGGTLTGAVSEHVDNRWNFEVSGVNAYDLLQVADAIARLRKVPDFYTIAESQRAKSEFSQAISLFNLTLAFAKKDRDAVAQANSLDGLAAIHKRLGNYDRAIEALFESLDVEASLAYSSGIVANLQNLAQDSSPNAAFRALQMRSHGMNVNRVCKLATIALLFLELDETEKATSYLEEAERLNERLANLFIAADLLTIRARLNLREDRWELAEQRLRRAIEIVDTAVSRQTADEFGRERLERGYALHQFRVDFPRGFDLIEMKSHTHPLVIKAAIAGMLVETHLTRANQAVEHANDHYEQASHWEKLAGGWSKEAGDDDGVTNSRFRTAVIAFETGQLQQASELLATVVSTARDRNLFETLWRALLLQAAIHERSGDLVAATERLEQAAAEIESLRSRIHSEPARRGFFGSKANVYEQLALLYVRQRRASGADSSALDRKIWQCMERSKARTLLDIVGSEKLQIRGADVIETRDAAKRFGDPLASLSVNRGADSSHAAYSDFVTSIANQSRLREVASLSTIQPTLLGDVQELLVPGELLVEYMQTEQVLLAAVISHDQLRIVVLEGMSRDRVNGDASTFREILQSPSSSYEASGQHLYIQLLAPCLSGSRGLKRICVVPAGALHYVPFSAFVLPNSEFLAERVQVYYAASASALVYSSYRNRGQRPESGQTLIVANPRPHTDFDSLPFAESEGAEVARIAPHAKLLSSTEATESAISDALPFSRMFHFAGHTHLLPNSPLRAALMCTEDLEDDGRLEVRELFGMDLSECEMAVLSACETRLGKMSRGDEIVGLERAFLRAGVPTVVASLWKVDDAATQTLMVAFYRNLFEKKLDKLEALRQAQLAILGGHLSTEIELASRGLGKATRLPAEVVQTTTPTLRATSTRHPRYWASFVLSGNFK